MGIPKFYRWLSERYPLINQMIAEDEMKLPEFDAMYVDANGIIHNCTHTDRVDSSFSHNEFIISLGKIFFTLSEIVRKIKPKNILFIAIDGCAPRAKMNQQRSRRFASARDRMARNKDRNLSHDQVMDQFDSNCITPGTEFMQQISSFIQFFIRMKITTDPLWRNLRVYFSGHDVPGEGEHKIMDFIRSQRLVPGYNPNTRHCIYGLDADLILLGLASHEPHFCLLREAMEFQAFDRFAQKSRDEGGTGTKTVKDQSSKKKWVLLHLSMLREYIDIEFGTIVHAFPDFKYDLEKVIDDIITLLSLVGNDFLPRSPSLKINDGALDKIFTVYKKSLARLGYLSNEGEIDFKNMEAIFRDIAAADFAALKTKKDQDNSKSQRGGGNDNDDEVSASTGAATDDRSYQELRHNYYKTKFSIDVNSKDGRKVLDNICKSYLEGIWYCHQYYFEGVDRTSWTWYYPYHYAPYINDMINLDRHLPLKVKIGEPFSPFLQLLGCLPPASVNLLPESYRMLMTSQGSPIVSYFPHTFHIDMDGAKYAHEGVALLPFIDEEKLKDAVQKYCPPSKLSDSEKKRNVFGQNLVFFYDATKSDTYPSPLPYPYRDIENCTVGVEEVKITINAKSAKSFRLHQLPGVSPTAGDPQVNLLDIDRKACKLEKAKINIFSFPSRNESLIISQRSSIVDVGGSFTIRTVGTSQTAQSYMATLIKEQSGKFPVPTVWVNYPYLQQAAIVSVRDDKEKYILNNYEKIFLTEDDLMKYTPDKEIERSTNWSFRCEALYSDEVSIFRKQCESRITQLLHGSGNLKCTGGIALNGRITCMIEVVLVKSNFTIRSTGQQIHCYTSPSRTFTFPSQLTFLKTPCPDLRLVLQPNESITERYPIDSRIICVKDDIYSMVGKVVGHKVDKRSASGGMLEVLVQVEPPKNHSFGRLIVAQSYGIYVKPDDCAKRLGITPALLEKLVSSLLLKEGHDLGLNFYVKGNYCPHFIRPIPSFVQTISDDATESIKFQIKDWELTNDALNLIKQYMDEFPFIFVKLKKPPTPRFIFSADDLFVGKEDTVETVTKWLAEINLGEPVFITSIILSKDQVTQISKEVVKLQQDAKPKEEVMILEPKDVLLPNEYKKVIRGPQDAFRLGDRVMSLGGNGVPFTLKGTVIGLHPKIMFVDVMFDVDFPGGGTLNGVCPSPCGLGVAQETLLPLVRPSLFISPTKTQVVVTKAGLVASEKPSQLSASDATASNPSASASASSASSVTTAAANVQFENPNVSRLLHLIKSKQLLGLLSLLSQDNNKENASSSS